MRIGDVMKSKVERNRKEENIEEKDPEIEMSLYYLGRALYRFSLMKRNSEENNN